MKSSVLSLLSTIVCAALVAGAAVEPRCESCEAACASTHFWYPPKSCCLPKGGPPPSQPPPPPPSGKGCPTSYYWHTTYNCCTPKNPPSNPNQNPTCPSTTYGWWDVKNHCCTKPPSGTNPPPPVVSSHWSGNNNYGNGNNNNPYGGNTHHKKSAHTHSKKSTLKARSEDICMDGLEACPIANSTELECIDPASLSACGGCPALNKGENCNAIANASSVSCVASRCKVHSCAVGYTPSPDGKGCLSLLTAQ